MWGQCRVDVGSIRGRCICGWKKNRINEEVEVEEEEQKKIVEEEGNQDCEGGGKINIVEREGIQE